MSIFSAKRHGLFIPVEYRKSITITDAFRKRLKKSDRKAEKICVDKDSEFYNRSMKSFLQKNNIEMYSRHNEGGSERFIRTLKNKIYKYMTSISKNVYIDKLDDIVNKHNNIYYSAIKMKPAHVKSNTYINSSKEINDEDPKSNISDNVRISKYKNIFAKGYISNWCENVIKKVKNTVPWRCVISDRKGEEIIRFTKKNSKKQIKKWLEMKK